MLRTFIAIDFPNEIKEKIRKVIEYFKTQTPDNALKWVSSENLHLTLKFLGEISETKLGHVKTILRKSLENQSEFMIGIEGLGMYPNHKTPRVIWLGITNASPLVKIHQCLDQSLIAAGIASEKRNFKPHLTIARIRHQTSHKTIMEIRDTLLQFKVANLGNLKIEEIILYRSKLTPKGPIYSPLMTSPLNKV